MSEPRWWQQAVIYEIYPRSFQDSDGDGVGDLEGILARVDYLQWLGIEAVWISPIYPSPMADFGYDVADYVDIDPLFGRLEDFDRLVEALHAKKIRLILDLVPNHTSDRHPWFLEARASRASPRRDWYLWRDPAPVAARPTTGSARRAAAPGRSMRRAASTTTTPSSPSSPTSTGATPRSASRSTTCSASGSLAGSTASGSTCSGT